MMAEALFVPSVRLMALIVMTPAAAGAVYVVATPLAVLGGENEPHGLAAQVALQVTPAFAESFCTVAVKGSVWEVVRPPRFGETLTVIG